jgi:hypothetical protein
LLEGFDGFDCLVEDPVVDLFKFWKRKVRSTEVERPYQPEAAAKTIRVFTEEFDESLFGRAQDGPLARHDAAAASKTGRSRSTERP